MPIAALAPIIGGALGALGGIFGGQKQTKVNWQQRDPRLYEFNPEERGGVRSGMLGVLGDILGNSPGGQGFWGPGGMGGGGGGGGFGASASPGMGGASLINLNDPALLAHASLIDMSNPAFSLTAPKPWMSGMLSKGREYTQAATNDAMRLMHDQALRAGVSTSSPAHMWMQAQMRRDQQAQLANALRDANLAWTLPAAEGVRGALGTNAQLGTNVSMSNAQTAAQMRQTNAQLATQASLANAAARTQASIANAGMRQSAAQFGAQFARQGYNDLWGMMKDVISPSATAQFLNSGGGSSGGMLANAIAGGMAGFGTGMDIRRLYGGGGQAGVPLNSSMAGHPDYGSAYNDQYQFYGNPANYRSEYVTR